MNPWCQTNRKSDPAEMICPLNAPTRYLFIQKVNSCEFYPWESLPGRSWHWDWLHVTPAAPPHASETKNPAAVYTGSDRKPPCARSSFMFPVAVTLPDPSTPQREEAAIHPSLWGPCALPPPAAALQPARSRLLLQCAAGRKEKVNGLKWVYCTFVLFWFWCSENVALIAIDEIIWCLLVLCHW